MYLFEIFFKTIYCYISSRSCWLVPIFLLLKKLLCPMPVLVSYPFPCLLGYLIDVGSKVIRTNSKLFYGMNNKYFRNLFRKFSKLPSLYSLPLLVLNNVPKISLSNWLCDHIILFGVRPHKKGLMPPNYAVGSLIPAYAGYAPTYLTNWVNKRVRY